MKVRRVVDTVIECGQKYEIMQMISMTEEERKFGDFPFIAIHESYDRTQTLNGAQTMLSRSYDELYTRIKIDAARRKFQQDNPDADIMEVAKFLAGLEV